MPGFTTHYLFGVNTYKNLTLHSLKKRIREHHAAFSLGLQGPDIFFFYLPSYIKYKNNIGTITHTTDTGKFLSNLIKSHHLFLDSQESAIAQCYIMGFIGHYLLDRQCHPYVYYRSHFQQKTLAYLGVHVNLETDIDTELLDFYKRKSPSEFHKASTLMLSRGERKIISTILYYAYVMTYPDLKFTYSDMNLAIRSTQSAIRLLHDPYGKKKVLIRKLEALTLGYPIFSPLIASDHIQFHIDPLNLLHQQWKNPWDEQFTSTASFLDLMDTAGIQYIHLLHKLNAYFSHKTYSGTARHCFEDILKELGNHSYHSGLENDSI